MINVTLKNGQTQATISNDGSISFDQGKTWSYWSNISNSADMLAYLKREGKLA